MSVWRKAIERGVSPSNIISWLGLKFLAWQGLGSLRLRLKCQLLGVELGRNVKASGSVCLLRWPGGRIRIGDNASLVSSWRRSTAAALAFPVRLRVFGPGAFIDIGPNCELSGTSITARSTKIALGKQVLIGPNCIIVDSDFHAPWPPQQRATEPGLERDRPVNIGDYAWIGMNSIILKGVNIGPGAIVGAGSVVVKDAPANSVVCGNPARIVKSLPDEFEK